MGLIPVDFITDLALKRVSIKKIAFDKVERTAKFAKLFEQNILTAKLLVKNILATT